MKNIIIGLLVCLIPNLCFGVSARYTQLVREKQQKMEQLEKCMGAAKGLQIAGVSTIGLTAVGVAGNIYEAKKIKDNEKTIENKKSEINKLNAEIAEKTKKQEKPKEEIQADAEEEAELESKEQGNTDCIAELKRTVSTEDAELISLAEKDNDGNCIIKKCIDHCILDEEHNLCLKDESDDYWEELACEAEDGIWDEVRCICPDNKTWCPNISKCRGYSARSSDPCS